MKKKDNKNFFEFFQTFIQNSDLKKYTPSSATILMFDNDSTFINDKFQHILYNNDIIHQPNILNDHHALGLVDTFARILKKTFTRIFLQTNFNIWVDYLEEVINNHDYMPHVALDNIKPNNTFLEKNFRKIYDINHEKYFYSNITSDIEVNNKVRVKQQEDLEKVQRRGIQMMYIHFLAFYLFYFVINEVFR